MTAHLGNLVYSAVGGALSMLGPPLQANTRDMLAYLAAKYYVPVHQSGGRYT
jgi:hypothetical protein